MDLTAFLLARLNEDEQFAYYARGILGVDNPWWAWEKLHDVPAITRADARHMERWSPARVLAEVVAKRAIVEHRERIDRSAGDDDWSMGYSDGNYDALYALAATWRDHPDYREEWRPSAA